MGKEVITAKQAIAMLVMFELGSALIHATHARDNQDFWLSYLAATVFALFTFFIYSRIMILYPGKNLLDINRELFGKVAGSIIFATYIFYAFSLGAFVTRHFTEVIQITSLPETPQYAFAICIILTCIYITRNGVETFGRWCLFALPVIIAIFSLTVVVSAYLFDFQNLKPVLQSDAFLIADNAFNNYSLPFGESVVFLLVIDSLNFRKKTLKVFYIGLILGAFLIAVATLRNILVLGMENIQLLTSASISAVSIIQLTSYLERIEIIVIINLIICGIAKIAVCLAGAVRGTAKLLNLNSERQLAAPIGLLMLMLSINVFKNAMQLNEWFDVYRWIFLPVQVLFPLVTWVIAEIKTKVHKNKRVKAVEQEN
ncbi:MAG TPA: endospore germination permease [Oscillospiraceae bacterium]|nr:endospore germination permease [Oscillospiraceae bacterium]HPS33803.1 endospore germination permease [Oscillospiraceae bacterium]